MACGRLPGSGPCRPFRMLLIKARVHANHILAMPSLAPSDPHGWIHTSNMSGASYFKLLKAPICLKVGTEPS